MIHIVVLVIHVQKAMPAKMQMDQWTLVIQVMALVKVHVIAVLDRVV
jgi:hypothetical protein